MDYENSKKHIFSQLTLTCTKMLCYYFSFDEYIDYNKHHNYRPI